MISIHPFIHPFNPNQTKPYPTKPNQTIPNMTDLNKVVDFTRVQDEEYEQYLTSIGIRKMKKEDNYFVLKYDRLNDTLSSGFNEETTTTSGLFRSVVVKDGSVISFSPPKSYSLNVFQEKYNSDINETKSLMFEEFVEGTMVNVFYNKSEEKWDIATKSIIGGKCKFYKDGSTFQEMFEETLKHMDIYYSDFKKDLCYSFVLQHPKNRIVQKVAYPRIILCGVYSIVDNIVYEKDIRSQEVFTTEKAHNTVRRPKIYDLVHTLEQAKSKYTNRKCPYFVMGVIVKYGSMRTKIRNPNYEYVRKLRGNHPKSRFQYLTLRKNRKLGEFLVYYPEYKSEFAKYREQVHGYTKMLYQYYIECFVFKKRSLREYEPKYKTHMYILQKQYLENMAENYIKDASKNEIKDDIKDVVKKGKITFDYVVSYVNSLHPKQLMVATNTNT